LIDFPGLMLMKSASICPSSPGLFLAPLWQTAAIAFFRGEADARRRRPRASPAPQARGEAPHKMGKDAPRCRNQDGEVLAAQQVA
jgi:hypothetical protein